MHRGYQPLTPANNMYLKQIWDQDYFEAHRMKVTKGKFILYLLPRFLNSFSLREITFKIIKHNHQVIIYRFIERKNLYNVQPTIRVIYEEEKFP